MAADDLHELSAGLALLGGGWWRVDLQTEAVSCSPGCRALLGLDDDAELDVEVMDRARPFPPGTWRRFESVHAGPSGPVRCRMASTIDAHGRLVGLFGLELPDTEGSRDGSSAAGTLVGDAQLVHDILALQPALVARYRLNGEVVWCNEAYAEHLGCTPEAMVGNSWLDLAAVFGYDTKENLDALLEQLQTITTDDATSTVVVPMWHEERSRWIQWTNRRIPGVGGAEDLIQAIGVEVTELRSTRDALDSLTREQVRARVSERRAWARRLHDDVMQVLVSASWLMAPADDGSVAPDAMARSLELVQMAAAELRSVLDGLSAPAMVLGSLSAVLDAEAFVLREAGVSVRVDVTELPDEELRAVCSRVLLEGMRNVAAHAAATEVTVTLRVADGDVVGAITDNGVGTKGDDLTLALASGHVGLLMSRAMVESLGGTFELVRNPRSTGTNLTFRIPLRAERSAVHAAPDALR